MIIEHLVKSLLQQELKEELLIAILLSFQPFQVILHFYFRQLTLLVIGVLMMLALRFMKQKALLMKFH